MNADFSQKPPPRPPASSKRSAQEPQSQSRLPSRTPEEEEFARRLRGDETAGEFSSSAGERRDAEPTESPEDFQDTRDPDLADAQAARESKGSAPPGVEDFLSVNEEERRHQRLSRLQRRPGSGQVPVGIGVQGVRYKVGEVDTESSSLSPKGAEEPQKTDGSDKHADFQDSQASGFSSDARSGIAADERDESADTQPANAGDKAAAARIQLSVVREAAKAETLAAQDSLDRQSLTKAVADLLSTRSDKHPLALALFGAWGAGKSSFLGFVRKELSDRPDTPFRVAEFNAWRNERVDNIGAALAQSVVESLVADFSITQQFALAFRLAKRRKERLRKAIAKDTGRLSTWALWISTVGLYFAWPLAIALIFLGLFLGTDVSKLLLTPVAAAATSISAFISARMALSKELLDWFKKLAKDQKFTFQLLPDYAEKLGSYHEMGRTLEDLCALTLSLPIKKPATSPAKKDEFLLLVIDDLDRCSPDTIKQVFDAVRLVANIPQVVVIVALDERIAYSAVAKHYAEYGFTDRETAQVARDYMSKVFNVFVTLPGAQKKSIDNYVRTKLFEVPASENPPPPPPPPPPPTPAPTLPPSTPSSHVEAATFAELVGKFELTNPRELWRMRQTWSLLKGFGLGQHASDEEVRIWMRHMFFREVFLRGPADQRKSVKPLLEKLTAGRGLDSEDSFWSPALTECAHDLATADFALRDAAVMAVLLPAAPSELKASKT